MSQKPKFPTPQYLGAKIKHLDWIASHIPDEVESVLDAFAGSHSVSFMLKAKGMEVISNDFMSFSGMIGKSLIENRSMILEVLDLDMLLSPASDKSDYTLMEKQYSGLFFDEADARFLDNIRANIPKLDCQYKQSIAFSAICRAMTRKVTMGHFAHTKALEYANNPERLKRNRSLARPIEDLFLEILPDYNNAVFDNEKNNRAYSMDAIDLLDNIPPVDLAYFDPPYCNSHADYQSFYHLLETFTEYWGDKEFVNSIRRYEPKRHSGFDKKKDAVQSFDTLFKKSEAIPYWIVSYNDRSYPSIEDLVSIVSKYRKVSVEFMEYPNSRGGKGSVAGSKEVLLICKK